jgi:FkbM family methyltransferase
MKFFKILIRKILRFYGYEIHKSKNRKEISKWTQDRGDESLRLFYNDLDSNSLVFDLGGYKGQWTSDIFSIYQCKIKVFEPVKIFFNRIEIRFKKNKNIDVYNFGLGKENKDTYISIKKDSSSIYKKDGIKEKIVIKKAIDFFEENNIKEINLMKINIEGSEYDLLDHLIATGLINRINNIQVQFHKFVPNSMERMKEIQNRLIKTHMLTYQYLFVWENWKKVIG